nr:MAG TPA: hypothetical protein [Crassvirales sp.]
MDSLNPSVLYSYTYINEASTLIKLPSHLLPLLRHATYPTFHFRIFT